MFWLDLGLFPKVLGRPVLPQGSQEASPNQLVLSAECQHSQQAFTCLSSSKVYWGRVEAGVKLGIAFTVVDKV